MFICLSQSPPLPDLAWVNTAERQPLKHRPLVGVARWMGDGKGCGWGADVGRKRPGDLLVEPGVQERSSPVAEPAQDLQPCPQCHWQMGRWVGKRVGREMASTPTWQWAGTVCPRVILAAASVRGPPDGQVEPHYQLAVCTRPQKGRCDHTLRQGT